MPSFLAGVGQLSLLAKLWLKLCVFVCLTVSGGATHQVTRSPSARQSPSASSLNRAAVPKSGSQTTLDKEDQPAEMTGSKFDVVSNYWLLSNNQSLTARKFVQHQSMKNSCVQRLIKVWFWFWHQMWRFQRFWLRTAAPLSVKFLFRQLWFWHSMVTKSRSWVTYSKAIIAHLVLQLVQASKPAESLLNHFMIYLPFHRAV